MGTGGKGRWAQRSGASEQQRVASDHEGFTWAGHARNSASWHSMRGGEAGAMMVEAITCLWIQGKCVERLPVASQQCHAATEASTGKTCSGNMHVGPRHQFQLRCEAKHQHLLYWLLVVTAMHMLRYSNRGDEWQGNRAAGAGKAAAQQGLARQQVLQCRAKGAGKEAGTGREA